jgi:two-component system phosphate regulon sensor histidine kinase PhoR
LFVIDLKLALFILFLLAAGMIYLSFLVARQRLSSPLWLLGGAPADWQRALDTAPFGLLLLDKSLELEYANSLGKRLLSPDWQPDLLSDAAAIQQGKTQYRTLTLPHDRAISWWISGLSNWRLVMLTDLSQQRRLERSSQMFLSTLSHELRTPLTAVLAHVEVMRSPDLPQEVRQNSLNLIHQETNRISRLVQNLLALSRLETTAELQQRPVDLLLIVEEAIAEVFLEAESRLISISLQAGSGLGRVLANPDELKQVLLNVLDNAVKYCRAGDKIEVLLRKKEQGVQIVVGDTGPGIPNEQLPLVTQKLYRGRTDVEGSGLGLAIVNEILQRHNSELQISSDAEGDSTGTTFSFVIPAA